MPRPGPIQGVVLGYHLLAVTLRGQYYLYLIEDIYSRKGWAGKCMSKECGEQAAALLQRSVIREQCWKQPLVLHSGQRRADEVGHAADQRCMIWVSRPRGTASGSATIIPYSESLFRTLKYCPQWPSDGFASLDAAREWVRDFMTWYNEEHRHSRIRFVTPTSGIGAKIKRCWRSGMRCIRRPGATSNQVGGKTRDWTPIGAVMLNPDRSEPEQKQAV